jgi:hypothetical protein
MDFKNEIEIVESVNVYLGASSNIPPMEILGGYDANYSVGNNALYKIRGNILDWKLLPKKSNKLKQIQTVNDILNLGKFIDNPKTLCKIIKEIYNLPDADLMKALSKSLNLQEPLEIALRKLYYVWLDLIEFMLAFLLEEEHIDFSPSIPILPNINLIEFENASTETKDFIKEAKKYEHKGYCPYEPTNRILNLFTFPLAKLIKILKKTNPAFMIGIDLNAVYHKIVDVIQQSDIENKKIIIPVKERAAMPKEERLDLCMEKFIELYRTMYTYLEEQERIYIQLAKKVVEICKIIETILTDFV